ncbi:hypothetical protein QBC45DRAFT_413231 [Copromyces sp. CBS 386.78]|nr:hypothetical protein QBC45DRAFT_413231 [Copromyces sp. CBS 386.78]
MSLLVLLFRSLSMDTARTGTRRNSVLTTNDVGWAGNQDGWLVVFYASVAFVLARLGRYRESITRQWRCKNVVASVHPVQGAERSFSFSCE